jgi:hypothetical protein
VVEEVGSRTEMATKSSGHGTGASKCMGEYSICSRHLSISHFHLHNPLKAIDSKTFEGSNTFLHLQVLNPKAKICC